jgi:hypothetical protein
VSTFAIACLCLLAADPAAPAAPAPKPLKPGEILKLFDGKTLAGWQVSKFGGEGDVHIENGSIILEMGSDMTGISVAEGTVLPKVDYEVSLEAMRLEGSDFFCGLTFPVGDHPCSFIVGGWGGSTVGLSSLNGSDASENETTKYENFDSDKWYKIRVRVTAKRIQAWIDEQMMADVEYAGMKISIRSEVDLSRPLGIANYATKSALRKIEVKKLPAE